MTNDNVSLTRRNVLRGVYLLNFAFLGANVWPLLLNPAQPIAPMTGIAFSFFAAFSTLCALGIRYPLQMLPVLSIQLVYKTIWLLTIALPLRAAGWSPEIANMVWIFIAAVIVDLLVIPWPHVISRYIKAPAEPWKTQDTRLPKAA